MQHLQDGTQSAIVVGLGVLFFLYLFVRLLGRLGRRKRRRQDYFRPADRRTHWEVDRARTRSFDSPTYRRVDSADQLRLVMAARFAAKRVMSKAEYAVFKAVEAEAAALPNGYRVFAQTSLGEVLWSEDRSAYSAINSKRVDVLVIGPTGLPVLAVEHQGPGHYQGDAAARDAVKKEALRRAGVAYIEVAEGEPPDAIRAKVRGVLIPSTTPSTPAELAAEPLASDR